MSSVLMLYQILLGAVFLISGTGKLLKMEEHKRMIFNYRILPERFIPVFLPLLAVIEFTVGILLAILIDPSKTLVAAACLMSIFTGAIVINLLRGRKDISCGCGGVMGNHKISWLLVFRNILIIIGALGCLTSNAVVNAWTFQYGVISFTAAILLLVSLSFKNLIDIQRKLKSLVGRSITE